MIKTLAIWIPSGLLLIGVGWLAQARSPSTGSGPRKFAADFLVGLAATTAALQLWSLFAPINKATLLVASGAGLAGLVLGGPPALRNARNGFKSHIPQLAVLGAAALWFAAFGQLALRHGDSGLYHISSVKWASEFSVVPGLGNLHQRLAFNTSFHLLAALFESVGFNIGTGQLINGLLGCAAVAFLCPAIRGQSQPLRLFDGLLLLPVLATVFTRPYFGVSPDVSITLLGTILASFLLHHFCAPDEDTTGSRLQQIAAVSALGLTMKLGFGLLAAIGPAAASLAARNQKWRHRFLIPGVVWGLLFFPWVARNVVLSGHLIFPVAGTQLPVEWAVPRSLTLGMSMIIKNWARRPLVFWTEIGTLDWIPLWLQNLDPEFVLLGVTCVCLWIGVAALPTTAKTRKTRTTTALAKIGLVHAAALLFWFATAPDPRFAGATPWVLTATAAAILIPSLDRAPARRSLLALSLFTFTVPIPLGFRRALGYPTGRPQIAVSQKQTHSGMTVSVPARDQCWDTPLPCTPYFRPALQRRGDSLGDGFILADNLIYPYMGHTPPEGIQCDPGVGIALVPRKGWSAYDPTSASRTIYHAAKMLVFATSQGPARLEIEVGDIQPLRDLALEVSVGESRAATLGVQAGARLQAEINLSADFNLITLAIGGTEPQRKIQILNMALRTLDQKTDQRGPGR